MGRCEGCDKWFSFQGLGRKNFEWFGTLLCKDCWKKNR